MADNKLNHQGCQTVIGSVGLIFAAIACIAAVIVVPEIRDWLGLESKNLSEHEPVQTLSTPIKITSTIVTAIASSPTIQGTEAQIPEETVAFPTRNNVEAITVFGNDSDGVEWYAPVSGTYILYFQEGAYNGWRNDTECSKTDHAEQGCWKTTIFIYRNCDIKRGGGGDMVEPINPDFRVGDDAWQTSIENAERVAKTKNELRIDLETGECLSFIAVDGVDKNTGFSAYSDNQGSVRVAIDVLSK